MSFYGSPPNPNTSAPQQSSSNPINQNSWSASALEQLVFQDNEALVNPMGGLRRPTTQAAPNDQSLPIPQPSPAELPNFANNASEKHNFLLDANRLDFDPLQSALNEGVNTAAQIVGPSGSQSQQPPSYRQPWEHAAMTLSGSNVSTLPPEAFDIAARAEADPIPDISAARGRRVRKIGLGSYIERLMNFNTQQQHGTKRHPVENFWKPLISAYFAPNAILHIDLKSSGSSKLRPIRVPVEALPRIWKTKLEAGVNEERILLEDPREFLDPTNGVIIVDVSRTIILSTYENSVVHNHGHLRVSFLRNKKIISWEFSSQKHEEFYKSKALQQGSLPPSPCCEFGMPRSVVRLMMIAHDINDLSKRMESEIAKLIAEPERIRTFRNLISIQEQQRRAASQVAGISNIPSNGNAFRALSSVLDGAKQEQTVQPGNADSQLGHAVVTGPGGAMRRDVDGKANPPTQNDTNFQLKDALSSLKQEQHASMMFQELFDDDMRAPLAPRDKDSAQKLSSRNQEDLKGQARHALDPERPHPRQRGQSAVEAAAVAAASGHGGWGVGSSRQGDLGNRETGREALDANLQLLNAATDANLTLGHDGGNRSRNTMTREKAPPPGLAIFRPQANKMERSDTVTRRERSGRTAGVRGMSAGNARPASNGAAVKDSEGLRAFQRMNSGKSKRESVGERRSEAMGMGPSSNFAKASQGLPPANGSIGNGKSDGRTDGVKNAKDRAHGTAGTRRSAPRNAASDDRLEKRQKTAQSREPV